MDNNGMPREIWAHDKDPQFKLWSIHEGEKGKRTKYVRADLAAAPTPDNNGWVPYYGALKLGDIVKMRSGSIAYVYSDLTTGEPSGLCEFYGQNWTHDLDGVMDGVLYSRLGDIVDHIDAIFRIPPPPALDKGE